MRLSKFTKAECENFRRSCNFTDDELAVFDLRVRGKSRVEISLALAISVATTDRRLRGIYAKVNKVKELGC